MLKLVQTIILSIQGQKGYLIATACVSNLTEDQSSSKSGIGEI